MVRVKEKPKTVSGPTHYVEPYFGGGSILFKRAGGSSPINYHGGKSSLAEWIIEHMPETVRGCEGVSEVVNDIDGHLTNFWRVLQKESHFNRFQRILSAVPVSRNEWDNAGLRLEALDPVERAVGFFIRARQSRQGIVDNGFLTVVRNRTRRGMQEQCSSWLSAVDLLPEIHERLQRVLIENVDAIELIKREDGPNTFFYLDPPYVLRSRVSKSAYKFEYSQKDHLKLLYTLGSIQGKFLLSGYWTKMYEEACRSYGWKQYRKTVVKASSGSDEKPTATEYLWSNHA